MSLPPSSIPSPTPEPEQAAPQASSPAPNSLLAHLAARKNHKEVIAPMAGQAPPAAAVDAHTAIPTLGFPRCHRAHSSDIVQNVDPLQLNTWFSVQGPTVFAEVLGGAPKSPEESQIAAGRLRASIQAATGVTTCSVAPARQSTEAIAENKWSPLFLISGISQVAADTLLERGIWAHRDVQWRAMPVSLQIPTLLCSIQGFTTNDADEVLKIVVEQWANSRLFDLLVDILSVSVGYDISDDDTIWAFLETVSIERLDICDVGGAPLHRFNIYCRPPTSDPAVWEDFRDAVTEIRYQDDMFGIGKRHPLQPSND
jgi:hypothetical protein